MSNDKETAVDMPLISGYCDRISARPGETLQFMVSAEGVDAVDVGIVRLLHGDENPLGPGFVEHEVAAPFSTAIPVARQYSQLGSFVEIPDPAGLCLPAGSFTIHAFIWPTTPAKGRQGILTQWSQATQRGFGLGIDDSGCAAFWLGDGRNVAAVSANRPLSAKLWYFIAASYDADAGSLSICQQAIINPYNSLHSVMVPRDDTCDVSASVEIAPTSAGRPALLAGYHDHCAMRGDLVAGNYNGKIDRCGIHARLLSRAELDEIRLGAAPSSVAMVARWDTSLGYTAQGIGDTVIDTGPNRLHGNGRNRPVRAMTGFNWRGRDDCFRLAPEQYGGIQFNDDAIIDSAWKPSFCWTLPEDLRSGVYAARLRGGGAEDHITFFVRPRTPQAKIAMLMPTASYLAYANEHFVIGSAGIELITAHPHVLHDWDYALAAHPEWGLSTYDHHSDGSGVCYTSWLRPIMSLRPRHRMASTGIAWQFPADLSIVWWLENSGLDFDIITDEDLHREGLDCLEPYNVVLNGTHSEYYSERMLDATEAYLAGGGRVMYMGGNGYYWVVAFRDEEPWCMEIRKLDAGSRAWQAAPGEHYMASNGERSGIWRNRGRPPQKITGVGFTSEGMDQSSPYRRLPDSHDPAVSWVFEGVEAEIFGDFGLALNGAAGVEIDRYDLALGTPPGTYLLACSQGHSDAYPHVVEEVMFNYPGLGGTQDFQVRADMTLCATTNGGAVFCSGSIAWGQALPCNSGDNDVARISANVLRRFMQDGPLSL
jgi:N,N-dimethylformamidase